MTDKIATHVWVVFSMKSGWPKFLGAYETEAKATADMLEADRSAVIAEVQLVGWAFDRASGKPYSNE